MHPAISGAVVAACTVWNVAGWLAILRATRQHRPAAPYASPRSVSVLKPLRGCDRDLYSNLRSFFEQDQPELELLFGVSDAADPALAVVERLAREFPTVRCKIVAQDVGSALNPKVQNLLGMLPHASHDLVLISDSNVRAPAYYVRELATIHQRDHAGIVTNLFAGSTERTLGAALDNVQLNGFCAAGSALPTLVGDAAIIGKSILLSRSALDKLGGLERLSYVLAEDFVLGKMFQTAGQRIVIAPTVLQTSNGDLSLSSAFARHLRWAMLRWRLRPLVAFLEPVTSPILMLPFAGSVLGSWAVLWALALLSVRDLGGWVLLRGWGQAWIPVLLGPVRDLGAAFAWLIGALKRHVSWRGQRLRLSSGTLLYAEGATKGRAPRDELWRSC